MFQLSTKDIHLAAQAGSKNEAITQVAAALTQAGCVAAAYVDGMLAREQQTSTYLGNSRRVSRGVKIKPPISLSGLPRALTNIWPYCVS